MPDLKTLSNELRQLEDQLVSCMKCGMCQSVCPLFDQTRKEADVARGKLVLLESLMNEIFDNPHGVNERLNSCLLCGSCAANCPSGVNATLIFIKARAVITGYLNLPAVKKIVFRKMLARPEVFDRIIRMGSKIQKYLLSAKDPNTQTASVKLISPLLKDRRIMPVADESFQELTEAMKLPLKTGGPRVAVFTGCLIDKIFPRVGLAMVKVLQYHHAGLMIPKNQGCCGIPALAAGDTDTFVSLVRHNVELFDPNHFDYLVTGCATCTSTLKKLWPAMVPDKHAHLLKQARALAEKTMDISRFLVNVMGVTDQSGRQTGSKTIVTYHDPCHLAKGLGIRKEPRTLIQAASGVVFKEMKDPDRCCGMGGSFNLYHYDISSKIGNIKKKNIEATGCMTLATSCPACMMQISDMLSKGNGNIDIKHPVELYAQGIK